MTKSGYLGGSMKERIDINVPEHIGNVLFQHTDLIEAEMNKEEFDPLYFLDLCSSIECVVLNEKLHSLGFFQNNTKSIANEHPLTKDLISEGILTVHDVDGDSLTDQILDNDKEGILSKAATSTNFISYDTEKMDLKVIEDCVPSAIYADWYMYIENNKKLSYSPNCSVIPMYLATDRNIEEKAFNRALQNGLAGLYPDYRDTLLNLRAEVEDDDFVRIPPIAFEVLNRISRLEDLPNEMLEARDRYKDLRKQFYDLDETLRSDDLSLIDKLKAKNKILIGINHFNSSLSAESGLAATSLANGINDTVKLDKQDDGFQFEDIHWTKLLGKTISKAESTYWEMKLKPLFSTKKSYLDASKSDMRKIIKKLFEHELSNKDIEQLKHYNMYTNKQVSKYLDI